MACTDIPGGAANFGPTTPNIYKNWLTGNSTAVGRRVNFHNTNDYALTPEVWQFNQITKPDWQDLPEQPYTYAHQGGPNVTLTEARFGRQTDPTVPEYLFLLDLGTPADVKDRYEIMSFAAEPRSKALGGTAGVFTSDLDVRTTWPPDDSPQSLRRHGEYSAHKWHSAQFRSSNMRQKDYWEALLGDDGFKIKPSVAP